MGTFAPCDAGICDGGTLSVYGFRKSFWWIDRN